jgi:aspartyl aminopeptidase
MDNRITALCDFLDYSKSVYHAQNYIVKELEKAGYTRLSEAENCRQSVPSTHPEGFLAPTYRLHP